MAIWKLLSATARRARASGEKERAIDRPGPIFPEDRRGVGTGPPTGDACDDGRRIRRRKSRRGPQAARRAADDTNTMEGVSLHNVNGSAPAPLAHGPREPLRKAVSQDEASALALLTAMPAPQLATAGILGTRLDAWA
jgi:hypothetical protein